MTTSISERILLVDDDTALLDAFRRTHRKAYKLSTAIGGPEGLEVIEKEGPFAVVVSDYQMPGMNGSQFLAKVCEVSPDTVRVMLTGNADLQSAIDAVNEGNVFRFLTKPCPPEVFTGCLDAALEQYYLRHAEQELLEHTLRGSIEVLADVLALVNPTAFGRATRIRSYVCHVAGELKLPDAWQYETAALLSQIGCVGIPDDILDRMAAGETLPQEQLAMLERHPEIARDLLQKIPRLETVADMISNQRTDEDTLKKPVADVATLGGRILAAAHDFDELLSIGASHQQALMALKKEASKYGRRILQALSTVGSVSENAAVRLLPLAQLKAGMIVEEDVRKVDDALVVPRGHRLTNGSLVRLLNYAELKLLAKDEFQVRISGKGDEAAAA